MPIMIRDKKTAEIVWKILGEPANLKDKPNKKKRKIEQRLDQDESMFQK